VVCVHCGVRAIKETGREGKARGGPAAIAQGNGAAGEKSDGRERRGRVETGPFTRKHTQKTTRGLRNQRKDYDESTEKGTGYVEGVEGGVWGAFV